MNYDDNDVAVVARTLWGEARGEPHDGKAAVAWVIRNRASRARFSPDLFGRAGAAAAVCQAPWQFSCWNEADPNRAKLLVLKPIDMAIEMQIATDVLAGAIEDPTNGADHYHTIDAPSWARAWPPTWAPTMREVARFGGHVFYDSRRLPWG
ncbi:MAG: cell wall hydrolase [Reyranella sp.]